MSVNMRYSRRQNGFTLVELLVAMSMGLIALSVMFTLFRTSNRSYVLQDYMAEMQQNLRMAMYYISRDVRMAGCGMNLLSALVPSVQIFNGSESTWTFLLPVKPGNATNAPDTIEVFYGDINNGEYDATITQPMPDASSELNVDTSNPFSVGDTVIISDGVTACLFVISEVQDVALKLQHNPAESPFNPPAAFKAFPQGGGYGTGSRLYNFGSSRWVTYSIDRVSDPDHPTLVADLHDGTTPQVIADNIEDIQFYYFMEGVPDTHDPTGNERRIRAVRISIIARTAEPDRDSVVFRSENLEDHAVGAVSADGYRRQVLSTMIRVRNM